MPVAVAMPNRPQEPKDPLDTILKGLDIASRVYGIKSDMDAKSLKQSDRQRELSGRFTKKELLDKQKDFDVSDSPVQGAVKYQVEDEEGVKDIYLKPKKKEEDPLIRAIREQQYQQNIDKRDPTKFQNLPKEKQITIEKLSSNKAQQQTINNQVGALISQLEDPNIPQGQKVASAGEQLKLLNSTLGADAVGAEEVNRIAKFLSYEPSPTVGKWGLGPDIEGYTQQLKNLQKRTQQSIDLLGSQIGESYGNMSVEDLMAEKIRRQGIRSTIPQRKK